MVQHKLESNISSISPVVQAPDVQAPVAQEVSAWKKHLTTWGTFAAASGAALAMSTNASAEIVYSGALNVTKSLLNLGSVATDRHVTLAAGPSGHFKMSVFDQGFGTTESGSMFPRMGRVKLYGQGHTLGLTFAATLGGFAKLYAPGAPINLGARNLPNVVLRSHGGGPFGPGTVSGFVGFKSAKAGDLGWLKVEVFDRNSDGYPDQVELLGMAYNNVPGGAINAGQTTSSATPEPNTAALGLLAAGAAGLLALRRRRAELAAKH